MSLFLNKEAETQNKVSEILGGKSIQEIVEYINENRHNINVEKVLLTLVDLYQQDFVSSQIMLNEMQLALAYYAINGSNDAILNYYGNSRFADIAELYKSSEDLDKNYSFGIGFNMSFSDYVKRCEEIEKTYESDLEKVRKMQEQQILNQEKPKALPTPKEVIQMMFDNGWKHVVISDRKNRLGFLSPSYCEESVRNCFPFDPKTGKVIVDFNSETGEVILENEK